LKSTIIVASFLNPIVLDYYFGRLVNFAYDDDVGMQGAQTTNPTKKCGFCM
jgi:hypothetical protein